MLQDGKGWTDCRLVIMGHRYHQRSAEIVPAWMYPGLKYPWYVSWGLKESKMSTTKYRDQPKMHFSISAENEKN